MKNGNPYKMRIADYTDAANQLGDKQAITMCNNTALRRIDTNTITLRLHNTDVAVFTDGATVLNSGGWLTVTTQQRINCCLPRGCSIYSSRGQWVLNDHGNDKRYFDGVIVETK